MLFLFELFFAVAWLAGSLLCVLFVFQFADFFCSCLPACFICFRLFVHCMRVLLACLLACCLFRDPLGSCPFVSMLVSWLVSLA